MAPDRRYVLAALATGIAALTSVLLWQILPTVFFAITVAYLLAPVEEFYERRGVSAWWASLATSLTAVVGLLGIVSPLGIVLYLRTEQLTALVDSIPEQLTVSAFGYTTTLTAVDVLPTIRGFVESVVVAAARSAPVLALKLTVFGIVVFGLLIARESVHDAVRGVVPLEYHDVVVALARRARSTLFAIYVLQAATAAVTFAVALPIFFALGYTYPFTLATIAGLLQFVPIIGPSLLIAAMATFDVIAGQAVRAALVAVVGLVVVAYLPDPLVRPRLARRTADMAGSLYFVGFTGGLFTVGIVGIIAGPLAVALLSESVELLGDEMADHREECTTRQTSLDEAFGAVEDDAAGDEG